MTNRLSDLFSLAPPDPPKRRLPVQVGGAGRGAKENIPAFREFNLTSRAFELVPVYTDPAPSKADALRTQAEAAGLVAGAIENKIEAVVTAVGTASTDPFILNLDRASGHEAVIRATRDTRRAILGYLIVRLPRDELLGFAYALGPDDIVGRDAAAVLCHELAAVSERNSSASIFGEGANPAHRLIEPLVRRWFKDHTKENLGKLVAALEPVSTTFQVMTDGREVSSLLVSIQDDWSDPSELAERIVLAPDSPLRRGVRFMVAEIVPGDGIRLHRVRRRTDDRTSVDGMLTYDALAVTELTNEELRRRTELMLLRAERETLSRRNPIQTTD